MGKLTHVTDPLGNVTTSAFDANGNLTTITDANGNATTYTYNTLNQLTLTTYADGEGPAYTYDELGNMKTRTDARGNTTTFRRDLRVTRVCGKFMDMDGARTCVMFRSRILTAASILFLVSHAVMAGAAQAEGGNEMKIKVTSTAFDEGGMIPRKYTCDGEDISPPLSWEAGPEGTKSLALISDDPDAPMGTWVHWVIFNIPADAKGLSEKVPPVKVLENGARQGTTDFKRIGYGGPCPPGGTHRYYFKVYALDSQLKLDAGALKKDLLKAMEGHILAQGELMGKYKR